MQTLELEDPETRVPSAKEVKRAFRRRAKACHPDVSSHTASHEEFLRATQAYEYLMAIIQGKEPPSGTERPEPKAGDWSFHDWYWSFSTSRRKAAASHGRPSAARAAPRSAVQDQLGNLRRRAAYRAAKQAASSQPVDTPEPEPHTPRPGEEVWYDGASEGTCDSGSFGSHVVTPQSDANPATDNDGAPHDVGPTKTIAAAHALADLLAHISGVLHAARGDAERPESDTVVREPGVLHGGPMFDAFDACHGAWASAGTALSEEATAQDADEEQGPQPRPSVPVGVTSQLEGLRRRAAMRR
ncbi:unnamed protein product [Pedinophyceae sp. YPF-701]|nr:unnamed protein product [Pedinophyceae sp. YPF-701]